MPIVFMGEGASALRVAADMIGLPRAKVFKMSFKEWTDRDSNKEQSNKPLANLLKKGEEE